MNSLNHVAIAGNIGAGKTTLVKKLAKHYQWEAHLEAVDNNPYLADFYADMKKWAFPLQIYFLHSRFNQVREIRNSGKAIIQDRTIYEDAYIFAQNLRESEILSKRDFDNYLCLFESMVDMLKPPDLMIYLRANISTLTRQIARRGRNYEGSITIQYLEDLNRHYESWISSYDLGKLLILEVDNLNYVDRPEDLDYVIEQIDSAILQTKEHKIS
ncbi:MAG: deoxynucleoside kinase [Bacteroidota bacterium]